ncbi:hypothetical protein CNR22_01360 [Sphingobacteriaceae bacterium]|nr:hypothetical protein CNR22_01360 [Sphingobacteriaceae bacterium]
MKKNRVLIFFALVTCSVYSQSYVDVLKVSGGSTSLNTFDSSLSKTRIHEVLVDATLPIEITQELALISGFIYENIQTKLFAENPIKKFGSTTLKLGVNNNFNECWSGTVVFLPKIASDFTTINRKDFQFGTLTTLKYKKSNALNYKFGLYYNSELFGPFFVPLLGVYYLSPNKKFEANILLPLQADMSYNLHSQVAIGFNFYGQIRSYHLTGSDAQSLYVSKSTNELSMYLRLRLSKSLSFQTKAGYSVGRSYRVYEENDKITFGLPATFIGPKRKQLNSDFSDGAIFQLSFLYRFNVDKN